MMTCPCGSGSEFALCCGPLLDGAPADTAEALMRSRYTAFARGDADHLFRTWHPRTRPAQIRLEDDVVWTGLRVIEATAGGPGDAVGTVAFEAAWRSLERRGTAGVGVMREHSRFERRAGRWFYVDGDQL